MNACVFAYLRINIFKTKTLVVDGEYESHSMLCRPMTMHVTRQNSKRIHTGLADITFSRSNPRL